MVWRATSLMNFFKTSLVTSFIKYFHSELLSQNLCVLRPYANETVLEGFIKVEDYLDITKEDSGGPMTKMIVTKNSKCYIFTITVVYSGHPRCLSEGRYSHEMTNASTLPIKYRVSIKI